MSNAGPREVRSVVQMSERPLAYIACACCVLAALAALVPYERLLGPEWGLLGGLLFPVAVMSAAQLYTAPYRHSLLALEKLSLQLRIQGVRFAIVISSLLLAWWFDFLLVETVWLLSIFTVVSYLYYRFSVMKEISRSLSSAVSV